MEKITISIEEYNYLQEARTFAEAFVNLLADKKVQKQGIYASEIEMLCAMIGIEVGE